MLVEDSTVPTAISNADQIKEKIRQLREKMQQAMPGYEDLLHIIHRNLAQDPDTVQLLTEEEIGVIVAGLQKRSGTFLAEKAATKAVKTGKKVGLDDL